MPAPVRGFGTSSAAGWPAAGWLAAAAAAAEAPSSPVPGPPARMAAAAAQTAGEPVRVAPEVLSASPAIGLARVGRPSAVASCRPPGRSLAARSSTSTSVVGSASAAAAAAAAGGCWHSAKCHLLPHPPVGLPRAAATAAQQRQLATFPTGRRQGWERYQCCCWQTSRRRLRASRAAAPAAGCEAGDAALFAAAQRPSSIVHRVEGSCDVLLARAAAAAS